MCVFKKDFIYLFLEKEREGERERNINVLLPLMCPLLGTWLTTQACALTENQTSDLLVHRPLLNPLSHTSQGLTTTFYSFQETGWMRSSLSPSLFVSLSGENLNSAVRPPDGIVASTTHCDFWLRPNPLLVPYLNSSCAL